MVFIRYKDLLFQNICSPRNIEIAFERVIGNSLVKGGGKVSYFLSDHSHNDGRGRNREILSPKYVFSDNLKR